MRSACGGAAVPWVGKRRRPPRASAVLTLPGHGTQYKGVVAEGEGVGGVRASAALFSHLSTFCKGGICKGRCEAPARAPDALGGRAVVRRRSPHARGAAHKTAAKGGTRQSCPPPPIPNLGRWDSRGGARRARGPGALGGRAGVRGATLASLCARLERVQGLRNGASAKASVAALGAAHGVERPPPRGRARGRAARSWPRRRWLSIREEGRTSRSSPLARARRSEKAAVDFSSLPSAHCPPTAQPFPPFSNNQPSSRPERQPLTEKVEESAGRRWAQAAPRRSRAPV